jgi:hypothetical protein
MQKSFFSLLLCCVIAGSIQAQKKDQINFSDPIQVDSSDYFLIPRLIDSDNRDNYGNGKGFVPWGNYNDVIIYNAKTNQSKRIFEGMVAQVVPFFQRRPSYFYTEESKSSDVSGNILPQHILYLARTDNYNKDNGLDTEDPVYLYLTTKTGDNLRQITPAGIHVLSWTLSKDKKMILVKAVSDKTGNRKFGNGDDQLYYRIDLEEDIAKIKCYPIAI